MLNTNDYKISYTCNIFDNDRKHFINGYFNTKYSVTFKNSNYTPVIENICLTNCPLCRANMML